MLGSLPSVGIIDEGPRARGNYRPSGSLLPPHLPRPTMPANNPPKATLDMLNGIMLKGVEGGTEFPAVQLWSQQPCLLLLVRRPGEFIFFYK